MLTALAVKAEIDRIILKEHSEVCWAWAYANGRENGIHVVGPVGRVSFAEFRSSDEIVVYASRDSLDFNMSGNIPSEEVYKNKTFFAFNQTAETARFVMTFVTGHRY